MFSGKELDEPKDEEYWLAEVDNRVNNLIRSFPNEYDKIVEIVKEAKKRYASQYRPSL